MGRVTAEGPPPALSVRLGALQLTTQLPVPQSPRLEDGDKNPYLTGYREGR